MGATLHQLRDQLTCRFDIPPGIRERPQAGLLPTGIQPIDDLIGGGIPKGTLTEICGAASSGRTTLLCSLVGQATRSGECCAWIDAAGVFDPVSVSESGAILERLLWVNCKVQAGEAAAHAIHAADLLIQAGGFGLVVLDFGDTPTRDIRRISLASWFRLRHATEKAGTALVALERDISARSCSSIQIELGRKDALWSSKRLRGLAVQVENRKHFRIRTAEFQAVR